MKIAFATDDLRTISQHFGRARYYLVFTVKNKQIVSQEVRERKYGHSARASHDEEHKQHDHSQGHGYGQDEKHDLMASEISDCNILIVGGMGRGAYNRFFQNGIIPFLTDETLIETALKKYIEGTLKNLYTQRTH